jgi:60 kDa SS-A/Ro ribonucleoprotein
MVNYARHARSTSQTPQSQPIPGREAEMTPNSAGGYGFIMDDWERLNRFLILGSDGTYYAGEQALTQQNAAVVIRCIKADGLRVVTAAHDINVNNRAPKVDQQLFAMALALKYGDAETKRAAEAALPELLRIGTHVLHFAAMLNDMGGWSRVKRRIIASWFEYRDPDALAFQCLKYQSRDGFSMRDLLRLAHPSGPTDAHKAIYRWVCGHSTPDDRDMLPPMLKAHLAMQEMPRSEVNKALFGIEHKLPREALPTEALADKTVWKALLPHTPIHALLRNLGTLSANGTLTNGSPEVAMVAAALTNKESLRKARVHPFAVLLATLVYKQGHGVRGKQMWSVIPGVLSALEDAYDLAFDSIVPTGKRILVAIDISGSMSASCIGTPISASTAAVAMAITLARSEPNAMVVQFDTAVQKILPVTKRTGLAGLESTSGGGTDLSAPVRWVLGEATTMAYSRTWGGGFRQVGQQAHQLAPQRQVFDAVVVLSDNETWAGNAHCAEMLSRYRREVNQRTKLVVCAMAANHASVVDPDDALSLGCAGLDGSLPAIVTDFIGS